MDCLKFLHEHGCPWDKSLVRVTATRGYYECMKYACDNGCPMDELSKYTDILEHHPECYVYLFEKIKSMNSSKLDDAILSSHNMHD